LFKITTNIDEVLFKLPIVLRLKSEIRTDLSELIRKDIEKNLQDGTGIDGASLTPKKHGGRLFVQSGQLLNSVIKQIYKESAIVSISPIRAQIATYINNGTKRMPQRQFFGLSQRVTAEIDRYLINKKFEDIFENRFN